MKVRVAIADDHVLVLNGVKAMLANVDDIDLVFTCTTGSEIAPLVQRHAPDVLLLDIQLQDASGIDLTKSLLRSHHNLRIIALTNHAQSSYVKQMMRNGAKGYLLKNIDTKTLVTAITTVMAGREYVQEDIKSNMLDELLSLKKSALGPVSLTKRENEILALIAKELTNQQIADKLFISIRTVQTHRINLTQKLGVHNTAGLVKEAIRRGLV